MIPDDLRYTPEHEWVRPGHAAGFEHLVVNRPRQRIAAQGAVQRRGRLRQGGRG